MAIYRILRNARAGKHGSFKPGDRSRLEWLTDEQVTTLINRGIVRLEDSPQLAELKGWQTRSRRLAKMDIATVEDFLDANADDVADGLSVKLETVGRWKKELKEWFQAPPARRG
jgi:hypothetical protein